MTATRGIQTLSDYRSGEFLPDGDDEYTVEPLLEQELALQRRNTLERIATECGLPASIFVVGAADDIRFQPSPDMPFERLDCALLKLRTSNIPLNTLGFVGNEAVQPEATNASSN